MNVYAKTALITGASSGIGAAMAKELAAKGARVILLARNEARLKQVVSEINISGEKAHYYVIDLADADRVANVATQITTELGIPDILINNAGRGQWKFIEETSADEAWQMMEVPYLAAFNLTRAFLPEMLKRNAGHIVNISSVSSRFVWPGATAYHAARWAMKGFNEALRADLHGTNIGVTLFESGVIETEYWQHNPGSRERLPKIAKMIPILTPEQVASAIVKGVEKDKTRIVIPFMMKIVCWQHFFFPGIVQWLMSVTGYRAPR